MRPVFERIWQAIPLKVLWLITLACLLIGEVYPFSNFPMFGNFSGKAWYVYLADEKGKAIPAMEFGVPTNGIKKRYNAELKRIKSSLSENDEIDPAQDRTAAENTLRYLLARAKKRRSNRAALRLVRVDLHMHNSKMIEEIRTAAEVALR